MPTKVCGWCAQRVLPMVAKGKISLEWPCKTYCGDTLKMCK
jgi:hypothetical protein